MKCPKCQFENPDNAKFCIECASPMEFHCPNCGAITPATGKFCQECAHDLRKPKTIPPKELSFDEKLNKIQKYLPKGLTAYKVYARILKQKHQIVEAGVYLSRALEIFERLGTLLEPDRVREELGELPKD